MRSDLRRKFRDTAAAAPIQMSVVTDVTPFIDEIYPLYLQVYERSTLRFEKLTKEFLCSIGRVMPDKVRFFIWRQSGKPIAFSLSMIHGDAVYAEYLGLDYSVALKLHLYFYAFRDLMTWAIANGYKRYVSTGLNYEPKWHLRFQLYPLDLYVRHTSGILNMASEPDIAVARADALRQDAAAILQLQRALAQRPWRESRGGHTQSSRCLILKALRVGREKSETRMRKRHVLIVMLVFMCGPAFRGRADGRVAGRRRQRANPH